MFWGILSIHNALLFQPLSNRAENQSSVLPAGAPRKTIEEAAKFPLLQKPLVHGAAWSSHSSPGLSVICTATLRVRGLKRKSQMLQQLCQEPVWRPLGLGMLYATDVLRGRMEDV